MRDRIELNPLRAFDADHPGTQEVMRTAPLLRDFLDPDDAEHFNAVCELLDAGDVVYDVDPTLVRGLDYYQRTVFEIHSSELGAQSALGGGGRYDGLVEQVGGPATPGMGWAAGVERILMAAATPPHAAPPVDLLVAAPVGPVQFRLAADARRAGLQAQLDLAARSHKGVLKHANRLGARYVAWVTEDGQQADLRDMEAGEQARGRRRRGHPRRPAGSRPVKLAPAANRYRDTWAGEPRASRAGEQMRVAGWVHRRRDHGGLIFIDLRDRSGLLQLVFHPETSGEAFAAAERLRAEYVLSAHGRLVVREEGNVNPNLPTGEVELQVADMEVLAAVRHAAVPGGRGRPGRREHAPALPLPRPAPRAHARQHRPARRDHPRDARRALRARTSSRSRRRC